jgi:hypothetical protein
VESEKKAQHCDTGENELVWEGSEEAMSVAFFSFKVPDQSGQPSWLAQKPD